MTVSLPAPVQAVFDATNAGDTAAFLDAFTADGVVDDWGREFRGHAEIQRWSDGRHRPRPPGHPPRPRPSEHVVTATVGGTASTARRLLRPAPGLA